MNMQTGSGTRTILHIGAPKCGSTALQSAFYLNREALRGVGIEYVGAHAHWTSAAKSVVGIPDRVSGKVPPISEWSSLLEWSRRAHREGRTALISSEWFASADQRAIERIVGDLGHETLQVVLAIRPLTSTLPSAWQQGLKLGSSLSLVDWLDIVLENPDHPRAQRVWMKHAYDAIAARWAEVVGKERVTVLIVDEHNPGSIFQDFARVLGIPEETLARAPKRTNPSLSAFEADVLAELNKIFFAQGGTLREYRSGVLRTFDGYVNSIRHGTIQKSSIPSQHLPAVIERNASIARNIEALGCTVIGDLGAYAVPITQSQHGTASATDTTQRDSDVRSAAGMMYSLIVTAGISEPSVPHPGFGRLSTRYRFQASSLVRRIGRAAKRAVQRRLRLGR